MGLVSTFHASDTIRSLKKKSRETQFGNWSVLFITLMKALPHFIFGCKPGVNQQDKAWQQNILICSHIPPTPHSPICIYSFIYSYSITTAWVDKFHTFFCLQNLILWTHPDYSCQCIFFFSC